MNKDEAVVAEKVTTYKRNKITKELYVLKEAVHNYKTEIHRAATKITELQNEILKHNEVIKTNKAKMATDNYKVELYTALLEAFNRDYPLKDNKSTTTTEEEETTPTNEITEPKTEEK